jgi:hypothetical protein
MTSTLALLLIGEGTTGTASTLLGDSLILVLFAQGGGGEVMNQKRGAREFEPCIARIFP